MTGPTTTRATRPCLAIVPGDPSGVGPEMAVKLLAREANRHAADLLLIADPAVLRSGERFAGASLPLTRIDDLAALRREPGRVHWLALEGLGDEVPALGASSASSGRAALAALTAAADAVRAGVAQGIVFAPLNKHSLRMGGMTQEDELRYLAEHFELNSAVCEFNITGALWTSRVSSHVPLSQVAALVTQPAVKQAVHILHAALVRAGIAAPRIAVSGLNPHAGDGGSIGREEIEVIEPAVQALRAQGLDVRGPFSPDTVFVTARRGDFDAVVSMYHDQGQIAMKLMGFESGVTLHGGLPVPVATPASGSAFDIAGQGVARIDGLQAAFDLCVRMAATDLGST